MNSEQVHSIALRFNLKTHASIEEFAFQKRVKEVYFYAYSS